MKIQIKGASLLNQHGKGVYSFKITAKDFLERGVVHRYTGGENEEDAIQRDLDQRHVLNIALAMLDKKVLWPDSVVIALTQEPFLVNGTLTFADTFSFSVDDGQHRWYALRSIREMGKELPDIEFQVFATYGLSVAERAELFKIQAKRKAVTRDFALALSSKVGQFKDAHEAKAYAVVLRLANDKDSVLKGMIDLPGATKPTNRNCWLKPARLVSMFRPLFFTNDVWEKLNEDQVATALKVYLSELRTMWSSAWDDTESYSLRSNTAIIALLSVFLSIRATRIHVKSYTEPEDIVAFARLFSRFHWLRAQRAHQTPRFIERALAEHLANAIERKRRK